MYALKIQERYGNMATFRDRFYQLKDEYDYNLDDIAKAINTNQASLSKVANGKLNLKKDMLESLADLFNVVLRDRCDDTLPSELSLIDLYR
jgi:transcriptional regulator with XRE-family HTH domain